VSVYRGPLTFSLRIGEEYRRSGGTDDWPAYEILPTTDWNYGLELEPSRPGDSLEVVERAWPDNDMPFTHEGTPVELRAQARKLSNWQEDHRGLVGELQPSPVRSSSPRETVALIPMGAARLRISAFPRIDNDDPDSQPWRPPVEPLTSYDRGRGVDPYEAMFDGLVPDNSHSTRVPRFSTYSFGGAEHGKMHWVQKNFKEPATVASCSVYWFDESPQDGSIRRPKSWRVLYRDGDTWKPVENPSGYGVELHQFNEVTFAPVKTRSLRLEVQCQDQPHRYAMGIFEWRIGSGEERRR
jgi:hypothetical protein